VSDLDRSSRGGTRRATTAMRPKTRFWECRCDCGRMITVAEDDLLSGKVTSCGQCDKPTEHDASVPDPLSSTRAH
jgi:hypothetical protein